MVSSTPLSLLIITITWTVRPIMMIILVYLTPIKLFLLHDISAKSRSSSRRGHLLSPSSWQTLFSCRLCGKFLTGLPPRLSRVNIPRQSYACAARRNYMEITSQSIKRILLLKAKTAKDLARRSPANTWTLRAQWPRRGLGL